MAKSIHAAAKLLFAAILTGSTVFPQSQIPSTPLQPGQSFLYSVRLRETTKVKTANSSSLHIPGSAVVDERALLKVEVLSVNKSQGATSLRIRTSFTALSSNTHVKAENTQAISPAEGRSRIGDELFVTAAIRANGGISDVEGLAQLASEQQAIWRAWALSFALATVPTGQGELALEPEPESSGELEGLSWTRELKMTGEQKCFGYSLGISREPVKSAAASGSCAKLTVREKLVQAPGSADRTPASYRTRNLKTSGTAHGQGERRVQLSNQKGVVVNSESECETHRDVLMERADRSDSIQYKIDTKTRVELYLITDSLLVETKRSNQP